MLEDRDSQQPRREDDRPHLVQDSRAPIISIPAADQQISVGLRLTIYVLPVFFLYIVLNVLLGSFGAPPENSTAYSFLIFLQELFLFLVVFLPACVMARLENRPVGSYGLPLSSFLGKHFWQGCAIGAS